MSESEKLSLPPLSDGWTYCELESLLDVNGISYGIVQPGSGDSDGVPIVRVKNIRDGRIILDDVLRVSNEIEQKYKRTRLKGGEILLTLVGTVGESAIAPPSLAGWNVARAVAVLRVAGDVSNHWLRICLSADLAQHHMKMWQTTTVQATLNLRDVRRIPIVMPPKKDRESIISLVGAIGEKIAANNRVCIAADELRRLRLFEFLESDKENTEERPLSSVAKFINGRAFTKNATGNGRMVIRIAELNSGPGGSTVYNDIEVPGRHLARPGDILFAWSGSLMVARWFRPEAIINQHIFKVLPIEGIPSWLVFELVRAKLAVFKGIAADKATTMGHIQRRHLDETVIVPLRDQIVKLDAELGLLWDRALRAEQETQSLAELRDALLPKLMSGEIKVRDAEKVVEDAL